MAVVSNPVRWESRERLAKEFIERMKATKGVNLYIVETAYGDRPHAITDSGDPTHLQLRTKGNVWIKESMINLGARMLPRDATNIAWIDADVEFRNPYWAEETVHQLQHHDVVQTWQNCLDLGPHGEVLQTHSSFGFMHQAGLRKQRNSEETAYRYAHTGYGWACTRAFWERVGGLPDFALLGAADHHSAWACVGEVHRTVPAKMSESYHRRLNEWQTRAYPACKGEVGFVPGRIEHAWHGSKKNRFYQSRWDLMIEHQYDPDTQLYHDAQGLVQVNNPKLHHAVHRYNLSRLEDATTNEY